MTNHHGDPLASTGLVLTEQYPVGIVVSRTKRGTRSMMTWETPDFVEIRMDAEINYMDDLERDDDSDLIED